LAFGLVMGIALTVGVNAVATYRELSRATEGFQSGDIAVADQLRAAQVAWKDRYALAALDHADAAHLKELEDSARSSLDDARTHASGDIKTGLSAVINQLTAASTVAGAQGLEAMKAVDAKLQELVDSQSLAILQHRTENDDRAAQGHDLI